MSRSAPVDHGRNIMKILVIGGTGLIGKPLVGPLEALGHEVVAASPSTGVNTVTGEGLEAAMRGTDVVIDIPNSPSFADDDVLRFFENSTENIVREAEAAGVKHHIVLSIAGVDRTQNIGYMRAKLAQERIARESTVPYTIVRATQFFEFIGALAEGSADGDRVRLSSVLMQPIAASDVSAALVEVATSDATNTTWELGGPEKIRLADAARRLFQARGDAREVVTDDSMGYFGGEVTDESIITGVDPALQVRLGTTTFDSWLATSN
jgi:uncharacterized protein YbjT (DUF2867 family)